MVPRSPRAQVSLGTRLCSCDSTTGIPHLLTSTILYVCTSYRCASLILRLPCLAPRSCMLHEYYRRASPMKAPPRPESIFFLSKEGARWPDNYFWGGAFYLERFSRDRNQLYFTRVRTIDVLAVNSALL